MITIVSALKKCLSVVVLCFFFTDSINAQTISTIAGNGTSGSTGDGGAATAAKISDVWDIKADRSGNLFLADYTNARIRKISTSGIITTVAGNGTAGFSGDGGAATAASMNGTSSVAVDTNGNVYFIDYGNQRVRKVNNAGIISTIAGTGTAGFSGDGGAATAAQINTAEGLYVDVFGNVYISDRYNFRVRKINTSGIISTIAGTGVSGFSGDGGPATAAKIIPVGVITDASGNVYISDYGNFCIRKINTSGVISTVAGIGTMSGSTGDGGPATAAKLVGPTAIVFDINGGYYIADQNGSKIRYVNSSGIISTVAGTGASGYSGDGGPATAATLAGPDGVALDPSGNLYIADYIKFVIRKVSSNIYGVSTLCSGSSSTFTSGISGGSWSSSNAGVATVGSATGIVNGVAAGTATITYNVSGTNYTSVVSVNAAPAAITGNTNLTTAITTTLADATTGGTWSSGTTSVATVATTGIVTGVSAGTSIISYTKSGCSAITTVNVLARQNGLYFDGTNDYVDLGNNVWTANSSYTKEAWVYAIASGSCNVVSQSSHPFWLQAGYIRTQQGILISDPTVFPLNTWVHIATTYDSATTTLKLYRNGTMVASTTSASTYAAETVHIGSFPPAPGNNFNGVIDEVRLWKVARSETQIKDNMNCDVAQQTGLIGYYRFNQGTAAGSNTGLTTEKDLSGNSKCGTLKNFALTGTTSNYVAGAVGSCNTITITTPGTTSGTTTMCVAGSSTLTNSVSGGIWTSSNTAIATVGSSSGTVTGLAAGTASITYSLFCTNVITTVTINALPTISGLSNVAICTGSNTTLTASGASTYSWSPATGLSATTGASVTATPTTNTTYTVTGTNSLSCTATASVTVTVNSYPTISSSSSVAVCSGTSTTLTATGGTTYSWSPTTGLSATTGASVTATPTTTTTYTVTGTTSGCSATASVTVTVNTQPAAISGLITPGGIITTLAGNGSGTSTGDGGAATSSTLNGPTGIAFDASGNIYVAEYGHRVRKISSSGTITTFAGTGTMGFSGDGSAATAATLKNSTYLSIDASGNLYISDEGNYRIRKVSTSGIITTFAGNGATSYGGEGLAATATGLNSPEGTTFDASGNMYLAGNGDNRVFKITPAGIKTTVAGNGTGGAGADGGAATATNVFNPLGVAVDASGNLYIADYNNNRIRKVSTSGIITTVVGTGTAGFSGDGGAATAAKLNNPSDVAIDGSGNMYIADYTNQRIRKVSTSGIISTIAGTGTASYSGDGVAATAAILNAPIGVKTDVSGNIYIADRGNHRLRKITGDLLGGSICVGASVILSNATAGGTWSSSNSNATVGSTGIVTGANVGTAVISYTMPGGCYSTIPVTVNAVPTVSVSSSVAICSGSSTTLTATGGTTFTWSPATSLSATTGASVSATPTTTLTYTVTGTTSGCSATASVTVTVKGVPTITSVSPLIGYPSSSVTITGSNFDATTTDNIVYFGATKASVSAASATSLSVTVPTGATFAPVTVNRSGCNLTALSQFPYLPSYDNSSFASGSINLNSKVDFTTGTTPCRVTIGDVDGDGKSDIIVTNSASNTVSVFRNTSTSGSLSTGSFAAKVDFSTGTSPYFVKIADIDGDGKMDLIVTNRTANSISVLRNMSTSGSISFAAKVDFTTGTNPYGLAIADLDGDGKLDVATGNFGSASVSVLRNTSISGSVSFATKVDFTAGVNSHFLTSGDIDGDGKSDIAVSNFSAATVSVFRNTSTAGTISTASFAAKVDFTVGSGPMELIHADIDASGKPDLIVLNKNSGTVSVLRNTGTSGSISTGTFAGKVDFNVGSSPAGLDIGDIDGDSKPDVVVVNSTTNLISILRNTATSGAITSGTFASYVNFTTNTAPFFVAAGDLDGDGRPDIVAANAGSSNLSIFRNNPLAGNTGTASVCVGGTTTLSNAATGGTWSSGSAGIATVGSGTGIVTGVAAGTALISYTLSGSPVVTTVTVNALPTVSAGSGVVICAGNSANLTATGGSTYSWSPATGLSATTGSGVSASPTVTTTYTVTGTNTLSCSNTASVTVSVVNTTPTSVTASASPNPICSGANLTLTGSATTTAGTISYAWAGPNSYAATTQNPASFVVSTVSAGVYTVTATNACGATTAVSSTVTVNTTPSVTSISGSGIVCSGQTTTLSCTTAGGTWSSSSTATGSVSSTGVVTGIAGGAYTISYGVSNSCGTSYSTKSMLGYITPTIGVSVGSGNSCVGSTTTYTGTPNTGYTWSSSDTAIATINSGGNVASISAGTTIISYVHNTAGCMTTAIQTVNAVPSFSLTSPSCATTTQTLTGTPAGGTWSSSNTTVATIGSSSGILSTIQGGSTNIQYTYGPCSVLIALSVSPIPGAISGTTSVCSGSTTQLTSGTASQTWSVANTSIATITTLNSTTSVVTGVSTGTTTVSYTNASNCSRVVTLTVASPMTSNIGTSLYCMGQTASLSNTTTGGSWTSSATGIATINSSTGLITPVTTGTSNITYSTTSPSSCQATTVVTVEAALPANTGSASVCVGQTTTLANSTTGGTWSSSNANATVGSATGVVTGVTAGNSTITYYKSDACYKNSAVTVNANPAAIAGTLSACAGAAATTVTCATASGTWSSSNTSVATIGSSTGVMTPLSSGTTTITYRLTTTGCFSTATFTVNPIPVSFTTSSSVCTGLTTTVSTTPAGGTWVSSATGVASIGSSSGILTGVTTGTTRITYTLATGCSRNETITVNASPAAITGTLSVCEGSISTLANTTSGGTWLSSNTGVATVGSASGSVTGVASGTSTISYQLTATGCYSASTFTVNTTPSAIAGTFNTCTGSSTTLTNTIAGGTWTSSAPAVATVGSASGTVTGVAAGTSEITYTLAAGCYKTAVITINAIPVISGTLELCDGSSTTLTATPTGGTWVSGSPAVVTVDSLTGEITGVSGGTSSITYTGTNSCIAVVQVGVNASMGGAISGPSGVCNGFTAAMTHATSGGTWTSSDTTKATINSSTGLLTALSVGSTTITYSVGGTCFRTKWVAIQIQPEPITGNTTICNGSYSVLSSTVGGSGTWSSGDTTIANPNLTSGMISGMSVGTTTITYRIPVSGCQVTTTVDVVSGPTAITGSLTVCQESSVSLSSTPAGGTWAISNEGVATTDSATGVISGVSSGFATVSYTLSTGCRATAEVSVNNMPAAISGILALCPAGTTTLSSSPTGGTWSSSTPGVATISTVASISPVTTGTTTITYTLSSSCARTAVVTVNSAPPAITGEGVVCVGSDATLSNTSSGGTWMSGNTTKATVGLATGSVTGVSTGTAVISYIVDGPGCYTTRIQTINATPAAITGTMNACVDKTSTLAHTISGGTWSSGNTSIATVDASGVVTAISAGYAMISYQTTPGCRVTGSFNSKALPAVITGTPYACVGTTTNLLSITTLGVWTSSNTGVATVQSPSGTVTGIASGTTTITYKLTSGCYRTTEVTVNAAPAAISGPSALCRTATTTLTCTPTGGTWISSTPAAATINSSTGELTGVAAGTTRITYTQAVTGCRSVKTMTIGAPPAAIAGTLSTCAGSATTLTNATTGGTWSSSDVSIATIGSSTGVATAVATGNATISYNHSGGCVATTVLTVTPAVGASSGDATLCVGGTTTLANTAGGGTWVSSTTAKATVGSTTGIVKGMGTGTATITYRVNPSCFNTRVVTVSPTPAAISGPGYVCINTDGSFTHAVSGGTWSSSNPAVGSIDGSTGVLRGITAGAVIITYVTGNGCFVTKSVNIANNPPAIAGNLAVCSSSASALTCVIGGSATWSSSNTAVGSIGSTSGMLTGIAAGTTTVTYRLNTTGCYSTATSTVNPLPASMTGSNTICVGATQTYSSTTTGGTWTSSNVSAASIGSTSGTATGITAGVITLSYTISTGCRTTKTVTVNSLPASITGTSIYCVGGSAILASATTGGTWSSDNAAASVAGSGTVTATTAGTSVISYTLATGCARYATVTVNAALPANTGNNSICAGGMTTLANTSGGGTWASSATTKATVGSASGIVTGVAAGTANVSFIRSGAGCISVTQVTVNAALAGITGTTNACVGASSTLAHAISGGTWTSSNTTMATVDASSGIVSGISAGTPVITYTASPGCYKTASFTVKALPSAITGNGSVCTGSATVLSGSPTGGTWASGNTALATINTISGALTGVTAGTVVITYKGSNGCYISTTRTVNAAPASITGTFTAAVGGTRTLSDVTPYGAWSSANSAIASIGAASGVVTGVASGSTLITYTLPNGCFKSVTFTVTAAKYNEQTSDQATIFNLYPNPSAGAVNIESSLAGTFLLISIDGKLLAQYEIVVGQSIITLPETLAAGVYMGRFTPIDGATKVVRLMYQP
jgi:uncharacterized protein YjdB